MTRHMIGIAVLLTFTLAAPAMADDWQSTEATQTLLQQMDASGAEAVAVRDPDRPDRFIAALRIPGQLLVVSATHPSVDLVAQRLAQGDYRDRVAKADVRYARMLGLLAGALSPAMTSR